MSRRHDRISNSLTFFLKYVFTTIWVAGFGVYAAVAITRNEPDRWESAVLWILGTVLAAWGLGPVKKVTIDGTTLLISNYFRDARVPLDQILDIRQRRWINVRPVTVRFRTPTVFGDSIVFIPRWSTRFLREDPVVERLRGMAREAVRERG